MNKRDMGDSDVGESLRGLRESVRILGAGERVEAALIEAFRKERTAPAPHPAGWWPRWALAVAATAVFVAVGLFALLYRPHSQPAPVATVPPPAVKTEVAIQPAPPPRRVETPAARSSEVAGEFITLVPDLTWGPGESAQIMRVSLPRSALQSFGLPVDENRALEMVRADIVVGHDMVARAIRIVR